MHRMKQLILGLLIAPLGLFAQHLSIGTEADYTLIKHSLQDSLTKKPCISYNLISRKKAREIYASGENYFINILFFPAANSAGNTSAGQTMGVEELLKTLPPAKELLMQHLSDYSSVNYTPNYKLDSVLVVNEDGRQQVLRGIVYIRIYLLKSFGQVTQLQTNNFLLNTKAKKTKLSYENGVPYIVEKNVYCDYSNKLFLVDLTQTGLMRMYRSPRICRDCEFAEQTEEFTFDPLKGITAVRCYVPGLTGQGFKNGTVYANFK